MNPIAPSSAPTQSTLPSDDQRLRAVATRLEATFLAEMLKHAGLGQARDAYGGGIGEDQFASFLADSQAQAIAARGGIGLAETLFNALKETENDRKIT